LFGDSYIRSIQFQITNLTNICFFFPQLSNAGGRLIIASDGIWDALSNDTAAMSCRGLPAELAAKLVVKVRLWLILVFFSHFQDWMSG
jgi:serine/threonine protein phosphatase PrpC